MTISEGCPSEKIYNYIDGEMGAEPAKIFGEHLETCSVCRLLYEQAMEIKNFYKKEYSNSSPRLSLWNRIQNRISNFRRNVFVFKLAAPAVAAAAVFISLVSVPRNLEKKELGRFFGQQLYYLQENGILEDFEEYAGSDNTGFVYQYLASDFSDFN